LPDERNAAAIAAARRHLAALDKAAEAALRQTTEHCEAELFDSLLDDIALLERVLRVSRERKQPRIDAATRRYRELQAAAREDPAIAAMLDFRGGTPSEASTARKLAARKVRKRKT
jgi:muramoyltetrapeptide carboxypeptidase LdcA involved in peptidoglycan recycling